MDVYEFELEQLDDEDGVSTDEINKDNILNSKLNLDVLIGKAKQTVKEILTLSEGDIIVLDKNIDQKLEMYVNDEKIAYGESIILDSKLAIRVSEAVSPKDEK